MAEHWYYIDAQVKGRVVVWVRANDRTEALRSLQDGTWADNINVELEIEGKLIVQPIVQRGEKVR